MRRTVARDVELKVDHVLHKIRDDPCFQELEKRVGLPH
jgi:hypothetical protein